MSLIHVETAFNIDLEFKLASFGKRILALLLDMVVICIYAFVLLRFVVFNFTDSIEAQQMISFTILAIPTFLYHLLCEVFMNGQSVGKKLMGIKVISLNGDQATLSQYLLRFLLGLGTYIFYAMPYIVLLILIHGAAYIVMLLLVLVFYIPDAIAMGVTKMGQRLGDLAAGTTVIDLQYRTGLDETIFLQVAESLYEPKFPQVMRLSDRDINGINNLLRQKNESSDQLYYLWQVAMRIKEFLQIETDEEPIPFFRQLMKDYNYLSQK